MTRFVLCAVLGALIGAIASLPIPKGAAIVYEFLPNAGKRFFDQITAEEALKLDDIISKFVDFAVRNPDTAVNKSLELIRTEIPSVYPKVMNLKSTIAQQIDRLSPEAQQYAKYVLRSLRIAAFVHSDRTERGNQQIIAILVRIYERGDHLPQNVQADLRREFPESWRAFEREDIRKKIEELKALFDVQEEGY